MARDEGWQGGSTTPKEQGGWADKGKLKVEFAETALTH
jgi:hypothetical protein